MRGYKVDSQGRKTTFFNNELDDKTKALIGDIAPKKVAAPTQMKVVEGASSWNQAGTFESKDHTKWAKAWLGAPLSYRPQASAGCPGSVSAEKLSIT